MCEICGSEMLGAPCRAAVRPVHGPACGDRRWPPRESLRVAPGRRLPRSPLGPPPDAAPVLAAAWAAIGFLIETGALLHFPYSTDCNLFPFPCSAEHFLHMGFYLSLVGELRSWESTGHESWQQIAPSHSVFSHAHVHYLSAYHW